MIFKSTKTRIILRIVLMLATLCLCSWVIVRGWQVYLLLLLPLVLYQCTEMFRFFYKTRKELEHFVESVRYRDFSRHFDVTHAPEDVQLLREGFNSVIDTFKSISHEKETQYQYLQKILELVDTGILSYNESHGEVVWMNESLKKMLQLPYLKSVHSLEKRDEALYQSIIELQPGVSKISVAKKDNNAFKVLLSATAFQTGGSTFKLIAFQNVNEALEETESQAWQKLLSVLTHEIMNSVAPISSLAETLNSRLLEAVPQLDNGTGAVDDLKLGIATIRRRSEGLLKFAETYRNLNKITTLHLQRVYALDIFENILQLMHPTLEQKNIEVDTILKDPDLVFNADPSLIEQVLINLVVNAIEAVRESDEPVISMSAFVNSEKQTVIKVSDNGPGIPPDLMERIFIPFFSTKKNGSGIGLSLCKQIMMLHKGRIQVQLNPDEGTSFVLTFPPAA
ncbi:MAG: GHKL domain-containing protein [Chitinophagaceae bacterium]|nr:MAG: GHKL domain-containing protein [Chitinophagaceae bacterium]